MFDTWYGAPAACAVSAAGFLAGVLFGFLKAVDIAGLVFGVLLLLSGLVLVAAFVRSLWKRAWGRAAAQLVLGLAGAVGFVLALAVAVFSSGFVAYYMGWEAPWVGAEEKNGVVPFEVEYQRAPAFSSEYFRRVAFASGKRVGIAMDTGGHAQLAVYALEDGTHALMDSTGDLFRVDAAAETVDMEGGWRWYRLPEGTEKVRSWGTSGVWVVLENGEEQSSKDGVPIGESLDGRRLLGKFVPYGAFVAEAEDWLAQKLTPASWEAFPKWPEELPFALERQRGNFGNVGGRRVAFPSGKAVGLGSLWDTPYSVQEMADGNYALKSERKTEPPFSPTMYRVRVGDECVDFRVDDDWVEISADILKITSWGTRKVCGLNADNEEACGTNSVPVGTTLEGMRPVGVLMGNGMFARAREGDVGAEGEAE